MPNDRPIPVEPASDRPVVDAVAPGVWTIDVPTRDFRVRGAVLVGSRGAVVFDTLSRPADMEPVRELVGVRELTAVYSHADWDHVWGTAALPHARVVACEASAARLRSESDAKLAALRAREPGRYDDVRIVHPTETFTGFHAIDLGGMTLELHALPGHTLDSTVGWVPELGLLLAADAVETPLPVVNEGSPVRAWTESLERWAADERVQLVIPAHGEIGGRSVISRTSSYLAGLLAGSGDAPASSPDPFYEKTHARNVDLVRSGKTT
jgi:glyoxylase-like metal-dependent hydrolase (beta-lactamase superfamily II)